MTTAALIPALDCSATIGRLVRETRKHVDHVLVVDDGSTDRTTATARRAGAEVHRHSENLGKGVALATGLRILGREDFSLAVTLDADGQHLPGEIPKLLAEAALHPDAIVIGERQIESEVAALNQFGNRFANFWVWVAIGRDLPDTQSGFRVYPIAKTLSLQTTGRRFDFETEVLIRAARAGVDIRSVPVRVYYPPPERRVSHFDKVWDTARIVRMVLSLMLSAR